MAGVAHDVLLTMLREAPGLLDELLQKGRMGDLVVITASRAVARWAKRVAQHRGELGTVKGLTPVVLHVGRGAIDDLLDPTFPALALFAVWAVKRRSRQVTLDVLEKAVGVTRTLPAALQEAQRRAMMALLGERLLDSLREMSMDVNKIPETKASRALREFWEGLGLERGRKEGESAGKRDALLTLLAARGLEPTAAQRKAIDAMADPGELNAAILRAASASTVGDVLADAAPKKRNGKANGHRG